VRYSPLDRVAGLGVSRRKHQDGGAMMKRPGPGSHFWLAANAFLRRLRGSNRPLRRFGRHESFPGGRWRGNMDHSVSTKFREHRP